MVEETLEGHFLGKRFDCVYYKTNYELLDVIEFLKRNPDIRNKIAKSGTAILMATHDYRLISKFPGRIIKCEKGSINELNMMEEKLMGN